MDRTLLPRDENKNFVSGEWSKREFLERRTIWKTKKKKKMKYSSGIEEFASCTPISAAAIQLLREGYSCTCLPACMNYNRHVKFSIIWGDSECEWGNWRSPPKYKVREWSQSVRSSVTGNLVCTWRKKGGGSRVALVQRIGGYECIIEMDVSFCCFLTPSISIHRQEKRLCASQAAEWWWSRRRWANSCMRGHRPPYIMEYSEAKRREIGLRNI